MENSIVPFNDTAPPVDPLEHLKRLGPSALKEAELYALAFNVPLAKAETLAALHPFVTLTTAPTATLMSLRGINPKKAAAVIAILELKERQSMVSEGKPVVTSMNDVVNQCLEIRDKKKEYLMAFFLNARHQLICKEVISIGTLTSSLAHPREIFAPAIGKACAGIIIVHNHPSGNPSPSEEDMRLTKRIAQAGQILGIELLDHLIVSENGSYSFKTAGLL